MKSITEALDLKYLILQNFEKAVSLNNKRKLKGYLNYVVAGGGPTGVELAGALGELKRYVLPKDFPELDINKINIYLVHSRDRILPMLSEKSIFEIENFLFFFRFTNYTNRITTHYLSLNHIHYHYLNAFFWVIN